MLTAINRSFGSRLCTGTSFNVGYVSLSTLNAVPIPGAQSRHPLRPVRAQTGLRDVMASAIVTTLTSISGGAKRRFARLAR